MDFYFSSTPYHILLSFAVAREHPDEQNILCVRSSSEGVAVLTRCIEKHPSSPFEEVYYLSNSYGQSTNKKRLLKAISAFKVLKIVREYDVKTIFVFNDISGDVQMFLSLLRSNVDVAYIEDGSAAYNGSARDWSTTEIIARKVFFGPWWRRITVIGTGGYSDTIWTTHSEMTRHELSTLDHKQIPSENLLEDVGWIDQYLKEVWSLETVPKIESVVLLPHSSILQSDEYKQGTLENVIATYNMNNTAIKYHPREEHESRFGFDPRFEIPQSIPAEILYMKCGDLNKVIGDLSTSLLTAKWLRSDIDVISYGPAVGRFDQNLYDTFDQLGITMKSE
ncbi:glycosyltransferase family 52 [Halostagnicola sp. A-GB9-2]|uniref:glycosyltransferase family 52 n=1 Tax=Halostagnicola sp. A-GB9-2 TaxID=3048066 RepID=UPI0024BF514A|nr:glycosyltransferase family 52 [Halostagnicola sp. A-GB9-2]MDJ1431981.1 glycosyltransferase family 52 [Halostagnicola sp. A-GB9-2]